MQKHERTDAISIRLESENALFTECRKTLKTANHGKTKERANENTPEVSEEYQPSLIGLQTRSDLISLRTSDVFPVVPHTSAVRRLRFDWLIKTEKFMSCPPIQKRPVSTL